MAKVGDIVVCSGKGWNCITGSICIIRRVLADRSPVIYDVEILFPSGPQAHDKWCMAGADEGNIESIICNIMEAQHGTVA